MPTLSSLKGKGFSEEGEIWSNFITAKAVHSSLHYSTYISFIVSGSARSTENPGQQLCNLKQMQSWQSLDHPRNSLQILYKLIFSKGSSNQLFSLHSYILNTDILKHIKFASELKPTNTMQFQAEAFKERQESNFRAQAFVHCLHPTPHTAQRPDAFLLPLAQ